MKTDEDMAEETAGRVSLLRKKKGGGEIMRI